VTWEEAVIWLRNQPGETELVRLCYFDDPAIDAATRFHRSREWKATQALLLNFPGKGRALDVGAGRGISSYALASDGWETSALEPDPSKIVGAQAIRELIDAAGLRIEVVQEWGEELPFPDGCFDLIYCRQVLHHARDLRQLCREIGRTLKPGGAFIAAREHVISRGADLEIFLSQHPLHRLYGGERAYVLEEYTAAIRGGGLAIRRILHPFSSEINLYPESRDSVRARIARKVFLPWPSLIPNWILACAGRWIQTPGRLFTFLCSK
jgi:SAM-dependent methyltransferase